MLGLLCRYGHHAPARSKALIDIDEMRQETYCKRCGVPMEREPGAPWRTQPSFDYQQDRFLERVR